MSHKYQKPYISLSEKLALRITEIINLFIYDSCFWVSANSLMFVLTPRSDKLVEWENYVSMFSFSISNFFWYIWHCGHFWHRWYQWVNRLNWVLKHAIIICSKLLSVTSTYDLSFWDWLFKYQICVSYVLFKCNGQIIRDMMITLISLQNPLVTLYLQTSRLYVRKLKRQYII